MPYNLAASIILLLLGSLVAIPVSFAEQPGGIPPGYEQAIANDIAQWERLRNEPPPLSALASEEPPDLGVTVSLDIISVDVSAFKDMRMFVSAKDQFGAYIPGLVAENFTLRVQHPKDGTSIGRNIPSFSVEELGEVESSADIVFIIDSTSSMADEIGVVRSNVIEFVDQLVANKVDYRLAGYHYGDEVPYRGFQPFTSDAGAFKAWVSSLTAKGGQDFPENPLDSIIAAGGLSYRADAQQIVVLITDAAAHVAGDGGNSDTNATFSAAGRAIAGLSFYYSSSQSQYASLGAGLGWPFSADTLLGVLGGDITGKYVVGFVDPVGIEDGLTRQVHFALRADPSRFAEAQYTPELVKVKVPGKVTNTDPVPVPIAGASIEASEQKSGARISARSDAQGKFTLELPPGKWDLWTVQAVDDPDHAPVEQSVIFDEQPDGSMQPVPSRLDFALPRSTVAQEKRRLRALALKNGLWGTATNTPFRDEANAVLAWLETIPDQAAGGTGPTDAQREGLKRLIQAHLVLSLSNSYASQDASTIGASVSEVIVAVLDITDVFNKLSKSITGLVGKMDTDSGGWLKRKTIGLIKKILGATATKLVEFRVKLVNAILSAVKWALADSPAATTLITTIQDALAAASGDISMKGLINSVVMPAISRQIVVPVYASAMEPTTTETLSRSQSVSSADFAAMATAIRASAAKLDEVRAEFDTLKGRLGTVATFKNAVALLKDIADTLSVLEKPLAVLDKVPVLTPYLVPLEGAIRAAPKVLAGVDAAGSVVNGGLSGSHLWGLSSNAKTAMMRAYDPSFTASLHRAGATGAYFVTSPSTLAAAGADTGLSALSTAIELALGALRAEDMEGFVDTYSDTLLPAMLDLVDRLEVLAAKTDAGMGVDGRPANYDLLAQEARNGYTGLLSRVMGTTSAVTGLTLEELLTREGFDDSEESRVARRELEAMLLALGASAEHSTDALVSATNAVATRLPAIVHLGAMEASVETLREGSGNFDITLHLANVGDQSSGSVGLTLIPPRLVRPNGSGGIDSTDLVVVPSPDRTVRGLAAGSETSVTWNVGRVAGQPIRSDLYTFQVSVGVHDSDTAVTGAGVLSLAAAPTDTDGDGMPDYWEDAHGLDPNREDADQDADGERLLNGDEFRFGYDPQTVDTDGDGIDDWKDHLSNTGYAGNAAGDINGDGRIDGVDLAMARAAWGRTGSEEGFLPAADMDNNGRIDVHDLMIIAAYGDTDFLVPGPE